MNNMGAVKAVFLRCLLEKCVQLQIFDHSGAAETKLCFTPGEYLLSFLAHFGLRQLLKKNICLISSLVLRCVHQPVT